MLKVRAEVLYTVFAINASSVFSPQADRANKTLIIVLLPILQLNIIKIYNIFVYIYSYNYHFY